MVMGETADKEDKVATEGMAEKDKRLVVFREQEEFEFGEFNTAKQLQVPMAATAEKVELEAEEETDLKEEKAELAELEDKGELEALGQRVATMKSV